MNKRSETFSIDQVLRAQGTLPVVPGGSSGGGPPSHPHPTPAQTEGIAPGDWEQFSGCEHLGQMALLPNSEEQEFKDKAVKGKTGAGERFLEAVLECGL